MKKFTKIHLVVCIGILALCLFLAVVRGKYYQKRLAEPKTAEIEKLFSQVQGFEKSRADINKKIAELVKEIEKKNAELGDAHSKTAVILERAKDIKDERIPWADLSASAPSK